MPTLSDITAYQPNYAETIQSYPIQQKINYFYDLLQDTQQPLTEEELSWWSEQLIGTLDEENLGLLVDKLMQTSDHEKSNAQLIQILVDILTQNNSAIFHRVFCKPSFITAVLLKNNTLRNWIELKLQRSDFANLLRESIVEQLLQTVDSLSFTVIKIIIKPNSLLKLPNTAGAHIQRLHDLNIQFLLKNNAISFGQIKLLNDYHLRHLTNLRIRRDLTTGKLALDRFRAMSDGRIKEYLNDSFHPLLTDLAFEPGEAPVSASAETIQQKIYLNKPAIYYEQTTDGSINGFCTTEKGQLLLAQFSILIDKFNEWIDSHQPTADLLKADLATFKNHLKTDYFSDHASIIFSQTKCQLEAIIIAIHSPAIPHEKKWRVLSILIPDLTECTGGVTTACNVAHLELYTASSLQAVLANVRYKFAAHAITDVLKTFPPDDQNAIGNEKHHAYALMQLIEPLLNIKTPSDPFISLGTPTEQQVSLLRQQLLAQLTPNVLVENLTQELILDVEHADKILSTDSSKLLKPTLVNVEKTQRESVLKNILIEVLFNTGIFDSCGREDQAINETITLSYITSSPGLTRIIQFNQESHIIGIDSLGSFITENQNSSEIISTILANYFMQQGKYILAFDYFKQSIHQKNMSVLNSDQAKWLTTLGLKIGYYSDIANEIAHYLIEKKRVAEAIEFVKLSITKHCEHSCIDNCLEAIIFFLAHAETEDKIKSFFDLMPYPSWSNKALLLWYKNFFQQLQLDDLFNFIQKSSKRKIVPPLFLAALISIHLEPLMELSLNTNDPSLIVWLFNTIGLKFNANFQVWLLETLQNNAEIFSILLKGLEHGLINFLDGFISTENNQLVDALLDEMQNEFSEIRKLLFPDTPAVAWHDTGFIQYLRNNPRRLLDLFLLKKFPDDISLLSTQLEEFYLKSRQIVHISFFKWATIEADRSPHNGLPSRKP